MHMPDLHHIPAGLGSVTPYLIIRDAEAALASYTSVLGAEEVMRHVEDGRVVHAKLRIGTSMVELGEHADIDLQDADRMPNVGLHLYVEDVDELVKRAAASDFQIVRPTEEQPYGDREATLADPFGVIWFVATHLRDERPPSGKT
jgi:PhnB protein